MMAGFDWRDVAAILSVLGACGGFAVIFLRDRLSGDFARKNDVEALGKRLGGVEDRVGGMEGRMATMPDHTDIGALSARVANLERSVAVVSAEVRGQSELLARVDRGVAMLLEHELREKQAPR